MHFLAVVNRGTGDDNSHSVAPHKLHVGRSWLFEQLYYQPQSFLTFALVLVRLEYMYMNDARNTRANIVIVPTTTSYELEQSPRERVPRKRTFLGSVDHLVVTIKGY